MITRIRSQAVCLAALCLFAPAIHASVITFNATGETANDSTLSGTVTIDTVAGTVTAVDLTMSGTFSFTENILSYAIPFDGQFVILADNVPSTPPWVDLFLPVTTLVGYAGGDFCSGACPINSEAAVVA